MQLMQRTCSGTDIRISWRSSGNQYGLLGAVAILSGSPGREPLVRRCSSLFSRLFRGAYNMRWILTLAIFAMAWPAFGQAPEILTITYDIEPGRRAMGKAVAIGPDLIVSADHVIRDDVSSLGPVLAVDRKHDRCLVQGKASSWSEVRRSPLRVGERLYFEGGQVTVEPDLSLRVISGRAISGMSGGPIWDTQGRIVSVVSEGEGNGDGRLWGYTGLAEWVDSLVADKSPVANAPPVQRETVACVDDSGLALNAPPVQFAACECVDCQCVDCNGDCQPTLALITAEWCGYCPAAKRAAEQSGVPVEVVDYDKDVARRTALLAGYQFPPSLPFWVRLDNGKPVQYWQGGTTPGGVRAMARLNNAPQR